MHYVHCVYIYIRTYVCMHRYIHIYVQVELNAENIAPLYVHAFMYINTGVWVVHVT